MPATLFSDLLGRDDRTLALIELIEETKYSAMGAEATVDQVGARAIEDLNCDIEEANKMVTTAQLRLNRLRAVQPRLEAKLAAALARESLERWHSRAKRLEAEVDKLATEFGMAAQQRRKRVAEKLACRTTKQRCHPRGNIRHPVFRIDLP